MDYVVGSVAALVSENVTPSRPKYLKRALTPTKHQPSPNVTPKSELVADRSIFLSPTLQKKKAIIKKSPKRIFESSDLDASADADDKSMSPKAKKEKKRFRGEQEADTSINSSLLSPVSPKTTTEMLNGSPRKSKVNNNESENKPVKKKKQKETVISDTQHVTENGEEQTIKCKSKKNKKRKSSKLTISNENNHDDNEVKKLKIPKNKKNHLKEDNLTTSSSPTKNDKLSKSNQKEDKKNKTETSGPIKMDNKSKKKNKHKPKNVHEIETNLSDFVNPNAITNQDSDSEHESDNDIESENEEINKQALNPTEESSDEEEVNENKEQEVKSNTKKKTPITEDEIKRTLFVGNVPYTSKCKKDLKKIFREFGIIETVRIRTVPVKDLKTTPKMALINNELHPDKKTVNVYIKYKEESSVGKALTANNTVYNDHHLRVSKSDTTGDARDPKCSIFVGNLPFALEDEGLRGKFEKCGEIESVRIIRDKKTNAGKGFGYVNFASKDGVELALALTAEDLTIKNRIIRVERCTQNAAKNKGAKAKQPLKGMKNRFESGDRNDKFKSGPTWNKTDGAYRRVANKRFNEERGDGPVNKKPRDSSQPIREKKPRKEFVGVTAEKKKKNKFNKGQKKKKALSEIMSKK